ncbi:MAG: 2,5-diketo-D-gluconate reductase B [Halobacteriales archaeon]
MSRDVIELPDVGLGTYRNTDPRECTETVRKALKLGYRHVDTAEGYHNEEYVGDGLAGAEIPRNEIVVATKVSADNLAYDAVHDHARASTERLGVDVIDLLYVHWPLGAYDPADTLRAFDELRDEGLIRHVGLSNFTPDLLDEARDLLDASIAAHQVEMHPLLQQDELVADAREHGHVLVAYSPIARGKVFEVPTLQRIAEKHDATPAQVSLAWLASKDPVVAVPKATGDHLAENRAAGDLELDRKDVTEIEAIDREERVVDVDTAPWNR